MNKYIYVYYIMTIEHNIIMLFVFYMIFLVGVCSYRDTIITSVNDILKSENNNKLNITFTKKHFNFFIFSSSVGYIGFLLFVYLNRNYLLNIMTNSGIYVNRYLHIFIALAVLINTTLAIIIVSCLKINLADTIKNTDIEGFTNMLSMFGVGGKEPFTGKKNNIILDGIKYFLGDKDVTTFKNEATVKPECCDINPEQTTGCVCVDPEDIEYIKNRGGNN
jgi:hypothetical protein